MENLTSEAEIHALDRALVVVSVDPDVGEPIPGDTADPRRHRRSPATPPIPGDTAGPQLREYADEVERVRLLYWVTALRTVVVVAYLEV